MVHRLLTSPALAFAAFLAAVVPSAAQATDDGALATGPHAEVRGELLAEFKYTPPPPVQVETSAVLSEGTVAPDPVAAAYASADVVSMGAYTVRENLKMDAMHAQILQQHAGAVTAMEMRKLGVGIHQVAVGPVHFFAGTAFYIPFVIGVGMSW